MDSFGTVFLSDNDDDGNQQTRICYVMPGGNYGYWPRGPGQSHWHEEQPGVVPAIVSAAVALAPLARPQIVACAIAAAPALVAAINDAAGGALAAQLEAASSPPTPLPGNSIGLDSTLGPRQSCASPPCP